MTTPIVLFIIFGAAFGWVTFAHRHLFSEGPGRPPDPAEPASIGARLVWVMVCSGLWPLMALTGLYSLWRLRRAALHGRRRTPRSTE